MAFLLPGTPTRIDSPDDAGRWGGATINTAPDEGEARVLAVTSRTHLDDALRDEPTFVLVDGDARAPLAREGWEARAYLPVPAEAPEAWLPADAPAACAYALTRWLVASKRWKRLRNRMLELLLKRRIGVRRLPLVTVGARGDVTPYVVRAACETIGRRSMSGWLMTTGTGASEEYRGVFHLFEPGHAEPRMVVKFGRQPGATDPFDRDRRGLAAVYAAGAVAARHAPALIASFESEGLPASIESAAVGERLAPLLRGPGPTGDKEKVVERVAEWIVELGQSTARLGALDDERRRLAEEVVPAWLPFGADESLTDRIPDVPAVLQHNDLWSDNVIVDGEDFTVIDWEDARAAGLPLWDLVYFLADSLARLDGAFDDRARRRHFPALFRGEARSSQLLFKWVRAGVEACGVPHGAVGPIVTACWMSLVLEHVSRGEDAKTFAVHGLSKLPPGEHWASLWLNDDELGPGWSQWQA